MKEFTPEEVVTNRVSQNHRASLQKQGLQPYGEKQTNPKKLLTANDYHHWMTHTPSVPGDAGSHLGMLEYEEHSLGKISYPPDHPRASAVQAGQYYPDGEPKSASEKAADAERARRVKLPPEADQARSQALQTLAAAPRVNRFEATCATCGQRVAPGEGRIERGASGYTTRHTLHP